MSFCVPRLAEYQYQSRYERHIVDGVYGEGAYLTRRCEYGLQVRLQISG